jgi:hypothetical protein
LKRSNVNKELKKNKEPKTQKANINGGGFNLMMDDKKNLDDKYEKF